jgi:Family of unknown function (DUF6069)
LNLHHPVDVSAAWPKQGGDPRSMHGRNTMQATTRNSLAGWGAFALLLRRRGARWWPFVGSTALAISIIGPSYLADGISAVSLICMHVGVGVVLITGFMRAVPNPYWIADAAVGRPWHRG